MLVAPAALVALAVPVAVVALVADAVEGHAGKRHLMSTRRERPCHRVPLHGDRGDHEHPKPGGSGQMSFLSLKDHSPVTSFSPWRMETTAVSPRAPYWASKNTLPGMVRYVFSLGSSGSG